MSKVKVESVSDGRIASEKIARVITADGIEEEVFVAPEQIEGSYLYLPEVYSEDDRVLVELPQESSTGLWRLWISRDKIESAR